MQKKKFWTSKSSHGQVCLWPAGGDFLVEGICKPFLSDDTKSFCKGGKESTMWTAPHSEIKNPGQIPSQHSSATIDKKIQAAGITELILIF